MFANVVRTVVDRSSFTIVQPRVHFRAEPLMNHSHDHIDGPWFFDKPNASLMQVGMTSL